MKPTAVSIYNKETIKDFARVQFCGRMKPESYFTLTMSLNIGILAFYLITMMLFGSGDFSWLIVGLFTFITLLELYMYFIFPKISYNNLGKLRNIKNTYIFTSDGMTIYSHNEGYESSETIKYDMLFKLVETSCYFFVFRNRQSAYIIDKAHMQNCSEEYIRNLLLSGGNTKHIRCRY